ncbi:MAG: LacI family DNA-binding transcriptional regulator [Acidimicrobiales bacterium]
MTDLVALAGAHDEVDTMGRVTLQTIADKVGVSRMTVSNAFSRPDQLSVALRERILAAADGMGYVGPDPAARALARGSTGAVGVLLTDSLQYAFTDEVATGFLGAVVDGLAPTGLAVTLLTANEHEGDVVPARDVAIDGALVYSCRVESPARSWLIQRKLPLVFVDQEPVPGISSVNIDDRGGARAAARHVVELGHRRVGIVTMTVGGQPGFVDDPAAAVQGRPQEQRMTGWLEALGEAEVRPTVIQAASNSDEQADEAALALLTGDPRPTAVLCMSDVLAQGVVRAARTQGLAVPEGLSVVGFDDSPVARRGAPSLTTVRQDVVAKGRLASEALTSAIEHARAGTKARARHRTLPTELVVRQSTASPAAGGASG